MTRPVEPEEATSLPGTREGVTIRRVETHENGLPVAGDLHLVHEMLEFSFEDHFNSYRESFPEFLQRLREDPGHRWDHWWLAFVEGDDGQPLAAGAVVSTVLPENSEGHEGSYIDYIGVHRHARGRGIAKSLLYTVIADAAAARPRPGRPRGRRRLAHGSRRALPLDGLGDRLRDRVLVQRARGRRLIATLVAESLA